MGLATGIAIEISYHNHKNPYVDSSMLLRLFLAAKKPAFPRLYNQIKSCFIWMHQKIIQIQLTQKLILNNQVAVEPQTGQLLH